jgi:sigma-B regulation protein RsbU (phosphoserine phosphatase)
MIRRQITIAFLLVSVASLLASGILSFVQLHNVRAITEESLIETAYENLQSLADETGRVVDRRLQKYSDELSIMRDYLSDIYANPDQYKPVDAPYLYAIPKDVLTFYYFTDPNTTANMDEVRLLGNAKNIFAPVKKAFPEIDNIYFASENGINMQYDSNGYTMRDSVLKKAVSLRGRVWYLSAKESGGTVITDAYKSVTGTGYVITLSTPLFSDGAFKGVLGMDIPLDTLDIVIDSITVGESGRAELIPNTEAQPAHEPGMLTATSKLTLTAWTVLYSIKESEVTEPVKEVDDRISQSIVLFALLLLTILILTAMGANIYANHLSVPLTALAVEKERISAELGVATHIQSSMLPHIFPPFPHRKEIDIFGIMDPAREVGGDFYDFFLIGEKKLAVVIADVSGKGVPAALFMVIAKTLLSNYALMDKSPKEVFETVNNTLCENNDEGLFVTCFMGYLDLETGELVSVNAGHNPPLLKRDGEYEYYKTKHGLVLAGMEDTVYEESETVLEPNDILYFYTDGVTEADNLSGEFYGEQRLLDTMNRNRDTSIEELCANVRKDVAAFAGEAPQADDITMLALRFNGTKAHDTNELASV